MHNIITILGFGNIGKQICSSLIGMKNHSFTINIIELPNQSTGAILDYKHAVGLTPNHCIELNNQELFNQSDYIFHCAGGSIPKGKSRLEVTGASILITEQVFKNYTPVKACKIIVVSNPVDLISFITQKVTGLPSTSIIGVGTFLDSIRMNYYLKNLINTKEEVDCVLLGEHGESAFVSHQLSTIGHQSIDQAVEKAQLTATLERTKGAAKEIKETEQATIYGVSFCAIKIFESLLEVETIKIPVSIEMPDWLCTALDAKQIFLSLYSTVNKQGAKVDEGYCPNKEELAQLKNSYKKLIPLIPKKYL